MSEHQSLVYIITFVFIGVAVFAGLELFDEYRVSSNKDAIIMTMNVIAEDAVHYRDRPTAMGGGGGEDAKYRIPRSLSANDDGTFEVSVEASEMRVVGTSASGFGKVRAVVTRRGGLDKFSYSGQFKP